MDNTNLSFTARPHGECDEGMTRWVVEHPDWDGRRGFAFIIEARMEAADRQRIKAVLLTPPIHIAPRAADRGKPRSLILTKSVRVLGLFKAQSWVEDLAREVAQLLNAGGSQNKADGLICKAVDKLSLSRVA